MRLAATAALIAALLLPNAVRADDLDTVFPGEELICYARIYTGGHLAAHPQQTVTSIRLFRDEAPVPSSGTGPVEGAAGATSTPSSRRRFATAAASAG
jgi:hypothetical protein